MPYQWGDQAADSYALIKEGKLITSVTGCGDSTPYLTESEAKCLTDGILYTSNDMIDQAEARHEYEQAFWSTAEKIGVAKEYRRLCAAEWTKKNDQSLSDLARKIDEAMIHFASDDRAEDDKTGILRRLLRHYRNGQNPLRSLRKEKGGVWTFHREYPSESEGSKAVIYHGDKWWVSWVK